MLEGKQQNTMFSGAHLTAVLLLAALLPVATATAQDQGQSSKFQIHGYITQAYATANFATGLPQEPTESEVTLGIPEEGTTDYRFLALQFRYEITEKDLMIVQLSSRTLGTSPISDLEDEIELDWGFYQRSLTDNTFLKIGRVPIPLGIFNEIRDVGTILPFYRPSFVFYNEGTFTSETVDGALLTHTFWPRSDWNLEASVYAGEWDLVETTTLVPGIPTAFARAQDSLGFQLWLSTPVPELRLGAGYQKRDVAGGLEGIFRPVGEKTHFDDWFFSVDAVFERFVARAEYRYAAAPLINQTLGFIAYPANFPAYAQVGFRFGEGFFIYLQGEFDKIRNRSDFFTEEANFTRREDYGIALNYSFSPTAVLKLEYHTVKEKVNQFSPVFGPGGVPVALMPNIIATDQDGEYTILSFSASF